MFKVNESGLDRGIRVVLGLVLLYLGLGGVVTGALAVVLAIVGGIALVTGLVGFCPLYALLKIRTNKS